MAILNVFARNITEVEVMKEVLDNAGLSFDVNEEFECLCFQEEEDLCDELEQIIDEILSVFNVYYRFELETIN